MMRVIQPLAALVHLLISTASTFILRTDAVHSAGGGVLQKCKRGGGGGRVGGSVSGSDSSDRALLPLVVVAVESATSSSSMLAKPQCASNYVSWAIKMKLGPKKEARIDYDPTAEV